MSDDATDLLRQSLGVSKPIRLAVSTDSQPKPAYFDIDRPYALIGRGAGSDILLPDPSVSFRHVYLQAFGNRVLCADLLSHSGIIWDGPDSNGWLSPEHRVGIGSFRLQLLDDGWEADGDDWPSPLECKTRDHDVTGFGELPDVHLSLTNRKLRGMSWPINRVMTLVGRDNRCRITCGDDRISRVHCSLVLTPRGLWVIDLLGRGGILVNGDPLSVACLQEGDELGIGQYRLRTAYESPVVSPPPSRAPADTTEFPVSTLAGEDLASAVDSLPAPEFLTRNNKIFTVEYSGDSMIVCPRGGIRTAAYQQMQLEANIITQLLATRPHLKSVVVDVAAMDVMDSIVISCVSAICRAAKNRAAICHCSEAMLSVLADMSLTKVWPYFPTREQAIEHIRS